MNIKKAAIAILAGITLLGTTALAKDNIYAYNKFVSTVIGPQLGYCDFSASFAGHELDYNNVNDYFSGLISAFYDDIDGDLDNELVTVDSHGVTVYKAAENGVTFLGSIDMDLIANFGDSYTNVFVVPMATKKYIGFENYAKTENIYHMYLYELNPTTDEFKKILDITRESNEDGTEERVWAKDKTYFSYTNRGGLQTSMNPDGYESCGKAAEAALLNTAPQIDLDMQNRIEGKDTYGEQSADGNYRINVYGSASLQNKTYIRATGIRFSEKPIVLFEDNSQLAALSVKPDIVTVTLDGETLQFPTQDPVIVDGRTLVPMRTIFEALGCSVDWKNDNGVQTVTAIKDGTNISMTIDKQEYFVNGEKKELDVPAKNMNDKTMVPLRAISESLGCSVEWNQDTKTVTIQSAE